MYRENNSYFTPYLSWRVSFVLSLVKSKIVQTLAALTKQPR